MKIFGYHIFEKDQSAAIEPEPAEEPSRRPAKAFLFTDEGSASSGWYPIRSRTFNGEKTPGELGNPEYLVPDHRQIRIRAHAANLKHDVVKIITRKFFKWVVGSGLKLQAEPNDEVLRFEQINEDFKVFRANVEAYFGLYAGSKRCDFSGMKNLHRLAAMAFESAFLGGDVLIVARLDELLNLNIQVIDGQHVVSPLSGSKFYDEAKAKGNFILHGIEFDVKGTHVAYYVLKQSADNLLGEVERISARGETTGLLMAWIIYGSKHRIDHHRGISQITSILEKVTKLDRYTEATVSSAEERAKLPWWIEHDQNSTGENPIFQRLKNAGRSGADELSPYDQADVTAKNISVSENKKVYNLPIGSSFKSLNSTAEVQYPNFFEAIFMQLCAAVDIPPEVALQKYSSNYSASRAAINGWGFIIDIYRKLHADDFYQPIYDLWLYTHILKNRVSAAGYLKAKATGNIDIIESYSTARFTGANMPHIDPLKEANAIRVMLGDKTTPLMSYGQASERLNNGEWDENIKKIEEERKLVPEEFKQQAPEEPDNLDKNATDSETEE